MFKIKRLPDWLAGLLVLAVIAGTIAPWFATALVLTAPAIQADAADPMTENAGELPIHSGQKLIAITFDDGPRRSTTTALLDGLAQRGVKATFFLIGNQLEYNQDLVLRMEQEYHQIGIHTFDHVELKGLSKADFDAQVEPTRQALVSILGHNDFLLRPPYGIIDEAVKEHAGCPIILWSIDPEDWKDQNTARVVEEVVSSARDGDIILMHDIFPESVDAALQIVDKLHAQGYLFVTIDQLFAARYVPLEAGKTYSHAYP